MALCLVLGAFANDNANPEDDDAGKALCPCPRNMEPVCASNMVTYSNRCLYECARRNMERSGRSLQMLRSGEC